MVAAVLSYKFDIVNIEFYDLETDVAMYACLQNRHSWTEENLINLKLITPAISPKLCDHATAS